MNTIQNSLKKHLLRGIFIGMLAILLLRTGGADAAALSQSCGSWSFVKSPNVPQSTNYLKGVAAVSANDVWTVGEYIHGATAQTFIEQWNGKSWNIVSSPNQGSGDNNLSGVTAISANDIWAVGSYQINQIVNNNTLIEHWDGTSWNIIPSPNVPGSYSNQLNGVAAVSTNDVWAVGYYQITNQFDYHMLIEHWDGTSWSIVPGPNPSGPLELYAVAASSANNVWAVDPFAGVIEHWDGTSWSIVPSPLEELYGVAAVSANDAWAVGTTNSTKTVIEHWNGSSWSIIPSPNPGSNYNTLIGVAAISTNDAWAVGASSNSKKGGTSHTLIEHWDGTSWSVAPSPVHGRVQALLSVAQIPGTSQAWAVGSTKSNHTLTEFYC